MLVGGKGTRLRPLTLSAPKPMLPTAGVPFLTHLLSRIRAAGISHVILGTSYQAEVFAEHFGDGAALGLELEYVVEAEPLGTGGAIGNVRAPAARRHRDDLQRRHPDRLRPDRPARRAPPHGRRRHAAPDHGGRPAGLRLRAHRRRRPGDGVPGEGPEPGHRPDQRRHLRVLPRRGRVDPDRAAGLGGARDLSGPARRRRAGDRLPRHQLLARPRQAGRLRGRICRSGQGNRPHRGAARTDRRGAGAARGEGRRPARS